MSEGKETEIETKYDDLTSSVVVISDDDELITPNTTPSKVTPASKRKRDILLQVEEEEKNEELRIGDPANASGEFISMERFSPEPRRKNQTGDTPNKPSSTANLVKNQIKVPDVVSEIELDNNLPETVTLLRTADGGKIYIVGTAHFSHESQEDVSNIIRAVQPHCVVVELCNSRTDIMLNDEEAVLAAAKDINFKSIMAIIRRSGAVQGLLYLTLLTMSAHVTRELGMAPGGEFRRAFQEVAQTPGCLLLLGDRAIHVTVARALSGLSWWQFLRLVCNLVFSKDPIKKEDVEKCKKRDFLEATLEELAGEFPSLKEVLVTERDKYLTYSLQNATTVGCEKRQNQPCRVVGVVGLGHVPGIQKYWNTITEAEVARLMTVPPPSLSSKILKFTFRGCLIGGVVYGIYKIVPNRFVELVKPW